MNEKVLCYSPLLVSCRIAPKRFLKIRLRGFICAGFALEQQFKVMETSSNGLFCTSVGSYCYKRRLHSNTGSGVNLETLTMRIYGSTVEALTWALFSDPYLSAPTHTQLLLLCFFCHDTIF